MESTAGGGDSASSSAPVAMETSKLLVGGGGSPAGDAVTSSTGSTKDYGSAQRRNTPVHQPADDTGKSPCVHRSCGLSEYLVQ